MLRCNQLSLKREKRGGGCGGVVSTNQFKHQIDMNLKRMCGADRALDCFHVVVYVFIFLSVVLRESEQLGSGREYVCVCVKTTKKRSPAHFFICWQILELCDRLSPTYLKSHLHTFLGLVSWRGVAVVANGISVLQLCQGFYHM